MRQSKFFLLTSLVCLSLFSLACNGKIEEPISIPVETGTQELPIAPSPTPSLTLIPTLTFTPSPTPTLTPTPTTTLFVLEGTPLPSSFEPINVQNAFQVSALAEWQVENITDMKWAEDNYILAVATTDQIQLFDIFTRQKVRVLYPQSQGLVRIDFSSDNFGTWLVAGSRWGSEQEGFASSLELWRGPDWQPLGILSASARGMNDLAFSPDGKALTTVYSSPVESENMIEIIDANRWVISSTLQAGSVLDISYSPDSVFLATSPDRYAVNIWQVNLPRLMQRFNTSFTGATKVLIYSPDGLTLATGAYDGEISVWDPLTGARIRQMKSDAAVFSLAFSQDGKLLASGSGFEDNVIRLWSVETGELIRELDGHSQGVDQLLFSENGQFLVSGSYDGSLKLWGIRP